MESHLFRKSMYSILRMNYAPVASGFPVPNHYDDPHGSSSLYDVLLSNNC